MKIDRLARLLRAIAALGASLIALIIMAGSSGALAQGNPLPSQPLEVGVYVSPPFVRQKDGTFSGMAIEIWDHVSERLGTTSSFQEFDSYPALIQAVAEGTVDVAVADLTITEERARILDFTHPWFDAGLRIMVHSEAKSGLSSLISELADAGHLMNYAWLLFVITVATTTFTIFDRRFDPEFPANWREGLAESFHHVMSIATSGGTSRKNLFGWIGRIWQALWLVIGIGVIAYITSSITSVMTASQLTTHINSVADLQGKLVGVQSGSVAEAYMRATYVKTQAFNHLDEAANALLNDEISAVVADNPILEFHVHDNPHLALEVVGNMFHPDKFGFAFPPGSSLVKTASIAIINLEESGVLEEIRVKHFGGRP